MQRILRTATFIHSRPYKNFGHKRQPEALVTVLWQGFLTFTFIGLAIEWEKVANFFFGKEHGIKEAPWANLSNPREDSPKVDS